MGGVPWSVLPTLFMHWTLQGLMQGIGLLKSCRASYPSHRLRQARHIQHHHLSCQDNSKLSRVGVRKQPSSAAYRYALHCAKLLPRASMGKRCRTPPVVRPARQHPAGCVPEPPSHARPREGKVVLCDAPVYRMTC